MSERARKPPPLAPSGARGNRWPQSWRAALVLPLFLAVQSWALEAHAGSRVLLLEFGGRKADVLREQVVKSLEDAGHTVVLSERTSRGLSRAQLGKLAKASDADALVDGRVRRLSLKSWSVSLRVIDADRGAKVGPDVKFQDSWLPGLAKKLTDGAAARLERALARASKGSKRAGRSSDDERADARARRVEEPESPEPAEEDPELEPAPAGEEEGSGGFVASEAGDIADDKSVGSGSGEGDSILGALSVRAGFVHRSFDFSDDIYQRLRKQNANIWVYQLQAEVFPFDEPVADHLGLIARYEGVFSGNVRDADFGGSFSVSFDEIFAGVRARYPLGGHLLGFDLTFGRMLAGLEDPRGLANIPEVNYTQLRSSLDVALALGRLRALASAGFRLPLGYGEVSRDEWFPRVGGYGVEATAGLEYPVSRRVSLELAGSLRRYLLEMNSEPEDAVNGVSEVAGGAVDLYTAGYLGMTFRL